MRFQKFIFLGVCWAIGLSFCILSFSHFAWSKPMSQTSVHQPSVPLLPLEDFFRKSEKTGFAISPDGKHLAWLAPWQSRLNIYVQTIGEDKVTRITDVTDRDLGGFFWASDTTIVFARDAGGDENFHLFAVSYQGGETKELTPFPNVRVEVVDDLEDDPDHVLIAMNQRDETVFDVYRLNLGTGKTELVAKNPGNVIDWLTDNDGRVRVAMVADGLNQVLLYRDSEQDEFKPILTTDFRTQVAPVAFTFDDKRLLTLSNLERDKLALVELDPATAKETKQLYEHPEVDLAGVQRSKHRKVVEGVVFVTDRVRYAFFDPQREALQKSLEAQFPDMSVSIVDRSKDENRLLIRVSSDRNPGAYYAYDVPSQQLTKLADVRPWIKPDQMAAMQPIQYSSRDGKTIHGYLTLPIGMPAKGLPIVVNPHGGPEARDVWGYNPEVQFLANRGYGVLQMNFRNSTGYGRKFWESGFKQWGRGAMQDDISDGVQWLIKEGIADPKRVSIYGASYGGYAALAGLAFTPDLYAAGVSYVGPSNLFTLLNSIPPYWEPMRQEMYAKIGNPEQEKDFMRSISPLFFVDQIKAPLFVAQGANDPRVKKPESDQIVEALRQRDIPVPYMVKANEGHGFHNEENQYDFYRALEAFLAEHLGGRSSTDISVLKPLEQAK